MEDKVRTDQIITWNVDAYLGKHKALRMMCNIGDFSSAIFIFCFIASLLVFIGGVVASSRKCRIIALVFIALSSILLLGLKQIGLYYIKLKNQCIIIHDNKSYLVFDNSLKADSNSIKMYCATRPYLEKSELETGKAYADNNIFVMYLHNLDPELLIKHNGKNTKIIMTSDKPGSIVVNIRYDMPFAIREHALETKTIYADEEGMFSSYVHVWSYRQSGKLLYRFKPLDKNKFKEYFLDLPDDIYVTYVAKTIGRDEFVVKKGDKLLEYEIL